MASVNITVRDLAALCPMRKILSPQRTKIKILHVKDQKTGHDLEKLVGNIVTKKFDAATEYDVAMKKRIGGVNFVIKGKIDILIREKTEDAMTFKIVELKYNPLFDSEPLKEHLRQAAIYAEIFREMYRLDRAPETYLQYWLVQNEDLAKFTVLVQDYPEVKNPFVKTYKIENTRKLFNEAIFDVARAVAWKDNFPGVAPVDKRQCSTCPYWKTCPAARDPAAARIYNLITYDKYKKHGKKIHEYPITEVPPDEQSDAMNYIKETLKIASRLGI